ncbi:hypothetical protein SAMN05216357_10441 [Porphyromonadaceae bacterium KH3CP3RA]|nr:hypothetical protein SAMN05216357_10441 [Porphyromonadaceae bacterium KH3CP3RA]
MYRLKKVFLFLLACIPLSLSAQFTVKAYMTTDQYNRKAIRIEIKNAGSQDLMISNSISGPENGTILHFSTSKKQETNAFFSFQLNPMEDRRYTNIQKGKAEKIDVPLNEVSNYIPIDKDIYLLGRIDYSLRDNKGFQTKEITIKVE